VADNVFEGYIYIIENYWAIHSLDLQTSMMGFPIKVKQNFAKVAPAVRMPTTHQYNFSGKVMALRASSNTWHPAPTTRWFSTKSP
jgi:hypothetical protein